jgi:lysophospholipase
VKRAPTEFSAIRTRAQLSANVDENLPMKLVPTKENPMPEAPIVGSLETPDGISLRYARWPAPGRTRGTVCLLQGRAEYIEKYFEVIRELRSRGFSVVTFDWRGQGLSQRALPDRRKGYVEDFSQYQSDLDTVIDKIVRPSLDPPLIGLAHSMGGAVLLRSLVRTEQAFDRIVLSAPMIGLPFIGTSKLVCFVFRALRLCGLGAWYVPGGRSTIMDQRPFEGNRRSSDPARYVRNAGIVAADPELGIGSPTIAWTGAALDLIHEFAQPKFAEMVRVRTLIVAAGSDQITSVSASKEFSARSRAIRRVVVTGAKHELLMERDEFRAQFWSAFDSFTE